MYLDGCAIAHLYNDCISGPVKFSRVEIMYLKDIFVNDEVQAVYSKNFGDNFHEQMLSLNVRWLTILKKNM